MNKKPIELHILDGTKPYKKGVVTLPDTIKKRVPQAEWLDNPDAWDKKQFIAETAEFLFSVYGIGSEQDRHTLAMLADHIDCYIECNRKLAEEGLVTEFNNSKTVGPNPYLTIRNKTMGLIIQLMNELGLTPRSRLSANKADAANPVEQFLKGPFSQ